MHDLLIAAIFAFVIFAPGYFASARASRMPATA